MKLINKAQRSFQEKALADARGSRLSPWQRKAGAGTAEALAVNKWLEGPAAVGSPPPAWAPLTSKEAINLSKASRAQDSPDLAPPDHLPLGRLLQSPRSGIRSPPLCQAGKRNHVLLPFFVSFHFSLCQSP